MKRYNIVDLIGAWKLEKWFDIDEEGNLHYPLGENVKGYIMYTNDGHMSANIIASARIESMPSGMSYLDVYYGDKGTYLSYTGTFSLEGDKVIHHVKVSSFPEFIGKDQERFINIDDGKLMINSVSESEGRSKLRHTLIWRKCK